ncbi:hypothetical protein VXQ18_03945 [Brucella abortus]|nr:hypothetical protein [Brucella abortus]
MAILGMALRRHSRVNLPISRAGNCSFRGQTIRGHNRLLGRVEGVDGIKTGYTNASGYNLVSSVNLDGRRLVAVVMGGNTGASRDAHMAQLIRKYLPMAARGRNNDALIAARSEAHAGCGFHRPAKSQTRTGARRPHRRRGHHQCRNR